jgi:hypothetical protein
MALSEATNIAFDSHQFEEAMKNRCEIPECEPELVWPPKRYIRPSFQKQEQSIVGKNFGHFHFDPPFLNDIPIITSTPLPKDTIDGVEYSPEDILQMYDNMTMPKNKKLHLNTSSCQAHQPPQSSKISFSTSPLPPPSPQLSKDPQEDDNLLRHNNHLNYAKEYFSKKKKKTRNQNNDYSDDEYEKVEENDDDDDDVDVDDDEYGMMSDLQLWLKNKYPKTREYKIKYSVVVFFFSVSLIYIFLILCSKQTIIGNIFLFIVLLVIIYLKL